MNPALMGNAQVNETAANSSSNFGEATSKGVIKKRSYKPQPVYRVLRNARKKFNQQLDKDSKMKIRCMETALAESSDLYPDKLRFELDFKAERDRLTDSIKFNNACKAKGKVPEYVADHTVYEGKAMMEKVLREGIQILGERINMFNEALWSDSQELYKKKVDE